MYGNKESVKLFTLTNDRKEKLWHWLRGAKARINKTENVSVQ